MDAMDRVIAELSPSDAVSALRLLKLLEECGQMENDDAKAWRCRLVGWVRFHAIEADAVENA